MARQTMEAAEASRRLGQAAMEAQRSLAAWEEAYQEHQRKELLAAFVNQMLEMGLALQTDARKQLLARLAGSLRQVALTRRSA